MHAFMKRFEDFNHSTYRHKEGDPVEYAREKEVPVDSIGVTVKPDKCLDIGS